MKSVLSILSCVFLVAIIAAPAASQSLDLPEKTLNGEVSQDIRNTAVRKALTSQPKAVLVYAKGLCCPSCSIGVRKKVSPLKFVDADKPDSGVQIDAKNQLVVIAVKPGVSIDMKALKEAIDDAGYPPVHLYSMNKGQLVTKAFATK
jgi:copper chaperone CopZ